MIGLNSAKNRALRIHEGRMLNIGSAKLVNLKLQLSLRTDSPSAKAVASPRGAGKSTRHIKTRVLWLQDSVAAKHFRFEKVATEPKLADMLTKALGRSKMEEFCEEVGQTELHAKTVDKKPKEAKKPKTVKFAADTNDETIRNKLKDSRIAKIKTESKDAKLRWMHAMN